LIARVVPKAAELKNSTFAVSEAKSLVQICPFGRNSFGGLRVNAEAHARGVLLAELAEQLLEVHSPLDEQVFRLTRIVQRDDLARLVGLPDLEFELHPDYGVGRDLYGNLFSVSPYRRRISGGHSTAATLLFGGPLRQLGGLPQSSARSVDLAPTVLGLLGVRHGGELEGRAFVDWQRDYSTR
jgi:hypothetical protein